MYTELFSEAHAVLVHQEPVSTNGALSYGYVDLSNYHRAVLVLHVGVCAGDVDCELLQNDDPADPTNEKPIDVPGWGADKEINTLTNTTSDICIIELRTEELDVNGGFHYVGVAVNTTQAAVISYVLYGIEPRYEPVPVTLIEEVVP